MAPSALHALVTGGNRGIGRAIASGLKAKGINVTIGVRDLEASRAVADALQVDVIPLDLTDQASIDAFVRDHAGAVDILVNNAGVLFDGTMLADIEPFDTSHQVMVRAPFQLIQAVLPGMADRGYGRIVNLSSGWGAFSEGLHGPNAYGVAKAGLNALTLALSREMPRGVKINAMCPGWVRTRMGGAGATLSPEEGADTAIWLATLADDGPNGGFFRERKSIPW